MFVISQTDKRALYLQIMEQIKQKIAVGDWAAGQAIPSIRQLAADIGVSVITVKRAPAYATVQDSGRRGYMASGVPRAGAMDQPALATLNALLGNEPAAAAIEWALTGGELSLDE